MSAIRYFMTAFVMVLFPVSTFADNETYLTKDKIINFVSSVHDVVSWNSSNGEHVPNLQNENDLRYAYEKSISPFESILNATTDPVLYDQLTDIVQEHGFKNLEIWAQTGTRLSNAYMAMNMGAHNLRAINMVKSCQKIVEGPNSGLPLRHQAAFGDIARSAEKSLHAMQNITPQEIKLVSKNLELIQETFKK